MNKTCGGISSGIGNILGLKQAGFEPSFILDDRDFFYKNIKTWEYHFPNINISDDFDEFDNMKIDVLISSPSCAQLSSLGMKREDRSELKTFTIDDFDFIKSLRKLLSRNAEFIIIEYLTKIEKFFSFQKDRVIHLPTEAFIEYGEYNSEFLNLNSYFFGVPQQRNRIYVILYKKKYNFTFKMPINYHVKSVNEVLETLDNEREIRDLNFKPPLYNDENPHHSKERMEGFKNLKYGESFYGGQNNRKLNPQKVCPTITSHCTRYVHPFEPRVLNVRECATFQGFPLDFEFIGKENDSLDLIGKSISPPVAEELGKQIMRCLCLNH
jgi:DNA (cytosine-5)-methyltransferase 1